MQLLPLLRKLKILTKDLRLVDFEPNWAQLRFLEIVESQLAETGRVRLIVLKARQLGISTMVEALLFTFAFLNDGYRGLVIAHEIPASQNLLGITRRYWEHYPFRRFYTAQWLSKNDIGWVETKSNIKVATAGNKAVGRSETIHGLHASEVAFWPEPRLVMGGLRQSVPEVPWSMIVLESTANGVGNYFHREWQAAEAGDSEYAPLFLPWHEHPEYLASAIGLPYRSLGPLDATERALQHRFGLSDDRLAWRRWAIRSKCQNDPLLFQQEYPSDPEEAFLSSGTNVFPNDRLRVVYEPQPGVRGLLVRNGDRVEFRQTPTGPLTVFAAPNPDPEIGMYIIGGDPTHTTQGDNACGQVLNRRTLEQVAVWRGKMDPGSFAEELAKLGRWYNDALLCPEIEGPGYMTVGKLLGMNYPNVWLKVRPDSSPGKVSSEQYGWSTTAKSKHLAIGWLLKMVMDGALTIHDKYTYEEMRDYVTLDNGSYGNSNGSEYDDTVMALAIAVTCNQLDGPLMPPSPLPKEPTQAFAQRGVPVVYGEPANPFPEDEYSEYQDEYA